MEDTDSSNDSSNDDSLVDEQLIDKPDYSSMVSSQFKFLNTNVDLKFSSETWRDYYNSRLSILSKVQERRTEEEEELEENGYDNYQTIGREELKENVRSFLKTQMLSKEVRVFILKNMVIFADYDYDESDTPEDMKTKVIMYSPLGLPRRIEVEMKAYFKRRMRSNDFSKEIRCRMIEGNCTRKDILLCSNELVDPPEVRKLEYNHVMEDVEDQKAPGLTRATAEDINSWLFGDMSTSSIDNYTLLRAIMLSVGAIDCSFADYPEYICHVNVSKAQLTEKIAAKGMQGLITIEDFQHLYDEEQQEIVYEKGWIEHALDSLSDKLGHLNALLYEPYDIKAAKVRWGEKVVEALDEDEDEDEDDDQDGKSRKRKRGFTAKTAWEYFGGDDSDHSHEEDGSDF